MTDYTDLIERLRKPTITPSIFTCREAADALAATVKQRDAARAELPKVHRAMCDAISIADERQVERDAALARVKRLEDALRKVAGRYQICGHGALEACVGCIARAALAEGDKP